METVYPLTWMDVKAKASDIAKNIATKKIVGTRRIYGIPRGGIFAAQAVEEALSILKVDSFLLESPGQADVFVDDIIDSGKTREKYYQKYPSVPFYALVEKKNIPNLQDKWVSFPWERMTVESGPEDNIRRILEYIGENPNREGLLETPKRVIRSYDTLFGGYKQDPKDIMKVFEDGACDELVLLKNIPFHSCCEHHILPFSGVGHIAYVPNGKVIGVSKLSRLLDIYARRLQIQERIGQQVVNDLMTYLKPKGAACVLAAEHSCMICRGVQKQGSIMVTSSLKGIFLDNIQTRNEFLSMIR